MFLVVGFVSRHYCLVLEEGIEVGGGEMEREGLKRQKNSRLPLVSAFCCVAPQVGGQKLAGKYGTVPSKYLVCFMWYQRRIPSSLWTRYCTRFVWCRVYDSRYMVLGVRVPGMWYP